jgi:hypothetical protein
MIVVVTIMRFFVAERDSRSLAARVRDTRMIVL